LEAIFKKFEWFERDELIKKFVSVEFNRFLEYYKGSKDLNIFEPSKEKGKAGSVKYSRFFINLGTTDKLTPPELIGLINDLTENKRITIGKIELKKNFSFFEADSKYRETILESTDDAYFEDRKIVIELSSEKPGGKKDNVSKKRTFHRKK
jgi:ATP-dependent RNA helicase DeaD